MFMRKSTIVGALCATALATTAALSGGGVTATAATAATGTQLRVGSFNVSGVTFDHLASGDQSVWKERRGKVASQILGEKLDAVGLQEANPSSVYKDRLVNGANQFMDLKNAISEQGGHYALTNEYPYNCVRATSSVNCVYQDRGAALDNRILYNTDTSSLVKQGSMRYTTQTAGKYERYLVWAVLKNNLSGKQFLFTNTHLDPYSSTTRVAQWKQSISKTNSIKGSLPVIAVGDYNTSKFTNYAKQMLPAMKSAGYGDVLNQEYAVNPVRVPRAETTTMAYVNSFNAYRRDATPYCYCSRKDKAGNNIDWVFASNNLPVKNWKVVMDIDTITMQLRGVIPSDHSLVRAVLTLP